MTTQQEPRNRSFDSFDRDAGSNYTWTARVVGTDSNEATVYARNQSFRVVGQTSFKPSDPHPSAVEYFLGALGADLVNGFNKNASRRGVSVYALEASLSGCLGNPLVHLGVVGEVGDPGFVSISATLYVSAEADESILREAWQETLTCSPIVNTLRRSVELLLDLQMTP